MINKLKAAYAATTPGEWDCFTFTECEGGRVFVNEHWDEEDQETYVDEIVQFDGQPDQAANMEFIALAHNNMPALLEMYGLIKEVVEIYDNLAPEHQQSWEFAQAMDACRFVIAEQEDKPLDFEPWLQLNERFFSEYAAESGMDRELDFDKEKFQEQSYELYLATFKGATDA
jgi:hypothetical protein